MMRLDAGHVCAALPGRPNPIGAPLAVLVRRQGATSWSRSRLPRRTPLIDLEPDRYQFTLLPAQRGDFETG